MKLTKTSWMFLVAGVLIIAAVGLGMVRSRQTDQQQQLKAQISVTKTRLALFKNDNLAAQKDQLTVQIGSYNAELNSAKEKISFQYDSISASNTVLKTAVDNGVDVVSIASSERSPQKLAQIDCTTIPLNIQVEGDFVTIGNFVLALSQQFPTSLANLVQEDVNPPPPSPVPSPVPTVTAPAASDPSLASSPSPTPSPTSKVYRPVSATINLAIYNYGGK